MTRKVFKKQWHFDEWFAANEKNLSRWQMIYVQNAAQAIEFEYK